MLSVLVLSFVQIPFNSKVCMNLLPKKKWNWCVILSKSLVTISQVK